MSTKLKIDLTQGLLEVEGSESFVKIIYNDFKTHFAGIEAVDNDLKPPRRTRRSKPVAKKVDQTVQESGKPQLCPCESSQRTA